MRRYSLKGGMLEIVLPAGDSPMLAKFRPRDGNSLYSAELDNAAICRLNPILAEVPELLGRMLEKRPSDSTITAYSATFTFAVRGKWHAHSIGLVLRRNPSVPQYARMATIQRRQLHVDARAPIEVEHEIAIGTIYGESLDWLRLRARLASLA